MEWIAEMIRPVIQNCESPQEARDAIIEWGKYQHERDATCALIYIDYVNSLYAEQKQQQ